MQKTTENAPVKDSLVHFGIVCTEFPFKPGGETKDLPKRDWSDEDGEDTYIPDKLPLKAYDLEAEMCYKGDLGTAYDKIMDEVLTFPVKFRVTDPRTQIIPSYSVAEPTKIVALVEKV